jgi:alkylated DNA repair dioxygenase AlkB
MSTLRPATASSRLSAVTNTSFRRSTLGCEAVPGVRKAGLGVHGAGGAWRAAGSALSSRPSMDSGSQLTLFGARPAAGFRPGCRHALDEASWVDHFPGWLAEPGPLFAALAALDGWEQRKRWMYTKEVIEPRLTAEFHSLAGSPVEGIGEKLSAHYGVRYDSAWLNWYRDHNDGTGWHADRMPSRLSTAIVPVLSLGAPRRFLLRPKDGGKSREFAVAAGDLVVMGGRCQRDWVHMVPKETSRVGGRISVNFGSSQQAAIASDE